MKTKTESGTGLPTIIGIDIRKEVFHLVGFGADEDYLPQEDQAVGSQRCVRAAGAVHRRHGSVPERALRQQDTALAGARDAASGITERVLSRPGSYRD